mmetsp:Transcript_45238/g.175637  ORF Transcript_45238/g.175637 Transcript_45238/m.175637 type:complete len:97 (-) Transcript_45238:3340-3630(-)
MLAWFTTMMETQTLGEAKKVSSKYWDWAMIQSGISEKSGLENGFGDLVTSLAMRKKILMDVNVKEVTYTGDAGGSLNGPELIFTVEATLNSCSALQ